MTHVDPTIITSIIQVLGGGVILWVLQQVAARWDRARRERLGRETREDRMRRTLLAWQEAAYDQRRAAIQAGVAAETLPPLPPVDEQDEDTTP